MNCLSVFDHFVGLALKGLIFVKSYTIAMLDFYINPFQANVHFLYHLKILENLFVFGFFQGAYKGNTDLKWVN